MKKEIKHVPVTSVGYTAYNTETGKHHVGTKILKGARLSPVWSKNLPDVRFLSTSPEEAIRMFNKKEWPEIVAAKITIVSNSTTTVETV